LEEIRSFEVVKKQFFNDDASESEEEILDFTKLQKFTAPISRPAASAERRFVPYFNLPWINSGTPGVGVKQKLIYAILEDRKICLESFSVNSPWRLSGTVLVKNLTFSKRVFVRMSLDRWRTSEDVEAAFITSVNPNVDRFHFDLKFAFKMAPGTRLELAFSYELPNGVVFWDNNSKNNYAFWFSSSSQK